MIFFPSKLALYLLKGRLLYLSLHGVWLLSVSAFEREKGNMHLLLRGLHITLLLRASLLLQRRKIFVLLFTLVPAFASSVL